MPHERSTKSSPAWLAKLVRAAVHATEHPFPRAQHISVLLRQFMCCMVYIYSPCCSGTAQCKARNPCYRCVSYHQECFEIAQPATYIQRVSGWNFVECSIISWIPSPQLTLSYDPGWLHPYQKQARYSRTPSYGSKFLRNKTSRPALAVFAVSQTSGYLDQLANIQEMQGLY